MYFVQSTRYAQNAKHNKIAMAIARAAREAGLYQEPDTYGLLLEEFTRAVIFPKDLRSRHFCFCARLQEKRRKGHFLITHATMVFESREMPPMGP